MAMFAENALLDKACHAIAALGPCPFAGTVTADQVKLALGEFLDIWPESIHLSHRPRNALVCPRNGLVCIAPKCLGACS